MPIDIHQHIRSKLGGITKKISTNDAENLVNDCCICLTKNQTLIDSVMKERGTIKTREIPLNLFLTWHTLDLPPNMKENVELLKRQNPEFNVRLFDQTMSREFIKEHFNADVVYAYDKLKPAAYKADLWRLCVLYIYGGIYLDIKYRCVNGFKLLYLTDKECWAKDTNGGVYNAIIILKKNNNICKKAIDKIVENVNHYYYGNSVWDTTGPRMFLSVLSRSHISKELTICLKCKFNSNNYSASNPILYKHIHIMEYYDNYRFEQSVSSRNPKYGSMYGDRDIFNYTILNQQLTTIIQEILEPNSKHCTFKLIPYNKIESISNNALIINDKQLSIIQINQNDKNIQHAFVLYENNVPVKYSECIKFKGEKLEHFMDWEFFPNDNTIQISYSINNNQTYYNSTYSLEHILDEIKWYQLTENQC